MHTIEAISQFIGTILLAGGGLSIIVYQVFKHLAAKWLDSKFEERLQDLKHKQSKEIEQLRFKISAMLDRTTKLHQREFEVLPDAWAKLNESYWAAKGLLASLQYFPDVNRMTDAEQTELIDSCNLPETQKVKFHAATDKTKFYQEHIRFRQLVEAENHSRELARYLGKNGIFISPPIREKFDAINDLIWSSLVEHRMNEEQTYSPREMKELLNFVRTGDGVLKELDKVVHERLWFNEAIAP